MAVNDAELRIVLRAVGTELLAEMGRVRESVDRGTRSMRENFTETERSVATSMGSIRQRVTIGLSGIQGSLRAFGTVAEIALAVLTVERSIASVIRSQQEWAKTTEHLHDALALNFEDVATLAVAARETDTPIEQLDGLIRGLTLRLNSNEKEIKNVGLETRTATGSFRPMFDLLRDGIRTIDEYRAGTDQLVVAQRIFGRGATAETVDNLRKTVAQFDHAREIAKDFGLVIGEDGVVKAQAFIRAQADLGLALLGVKNVIAEQLRPEFERIIETVVELARDGKLQAWAHDAAEGLVGLGEDIVDLTKFLAAHTAQIKAAGIAWGSYRVALLLFSGASSVIGTLNAIQRAVEGVQAARGLQNLGVAISAAGSAGLIVAREMNQLGVSMGVAQAAAGGLEAVTATSTVRMGFLRAAVVAAGTALGPAGIVAGLIAAGAGLITYKGWWDDIGEAISHAWDVLRGFHDENERPVVKSAEDLQRALDIAAASYDRLIAARRAANDEAGAQDLERQKANRLAEIRTTNETATVRVAQLDARDQLPAAREKLLGLKHEVDSTTAAVKALADEGTKSGAVYNAAVDKMRQAQAAFDLQLKETERLEDVLGIEGPPEPETGGTKVAPPSAEQLAKDAKDAFTFLQRKQADELALVENNEAAKLAIIRDYTNRINAIRGLGESDRLVQTKILHDAETRAAKERRDLTELDEKARTDRLLASLDVEKGILEQRKKAGLITEEEKLQAFRDIEDRRLAIVREHLEAELRLQVPDASRLADLRTRLAGASTAAEQQTILGEFKVPDSKKFLETLDEIESETQKSAARIKAIEFDINDERMKQKAEEIRSIFDSVFGDVSAAAQRFSSVLVEGDQSGAAGQVQSLRLELRHAQEDMRYAEVASGRLSDAFVEARQRETQAQLRLNDAIRGQSTLQRAAAAAGREFYTQALAQATGFVLDIIKLQALRYAEELLGHQRLIDLDKLSGAQRLALYIGDLTRRTIAETAARTRRLALTATTEQQITNIVNFHNAQRLVSLLAHNAAELANTIATETAKTAVTLGENAIRLGSMVAALATALAKLAAHAIATIFSSAAEGGAKAGAAAAGNDPYGITAAVVTNVTYANIAAMAANVVSSAEGGWDVPDAPGAFPMLAHRRERVLPAAEADSLRRIEPLIRQLPTIRAPFASLAGPSDISKGPSGPVTHNVYHTSIVNNNQMLDARGARRVFEDNKRALVEVIAREVAGRPAPRRHP